MDCQKVVSVLCSHCKNRCDKYYAQIKNKKGGISYIESLHESKRVLNLSHMSPATVNKISVDINAYRA